MNTAEPENDWVTVWTVGEWISNELDRLEKIMDWKGWRRWKLGLRRETVLADMEGGALLEASKADSSLQLYL